MRTVRCGWRCRISFALRVGCICRLSFTSTLRAQMYVAVAVRTTWLRVVQEPNACSPLQLRGLDFDRGGLLLFSVFSLPSEHFILKRYNLTGRHVEREDYILATGEPRSGCTAWTMAEVLLISAESRRLLHSEDRRDVLDIMVVVVASAP